MATTANVRKMPAAATADMLRPSRSLWKDAWYQFRRHTLAMAGMVTLIILILGTTIGPFIYTTPINGIDFGRAIQGPSVAHPFGTDDLGRDMLARVLWGGRVSIAVGITAVLLAITLGTAFGALAGYFKSLDNPLMRITDLFLSLPILPLLLIIIFLFRDTLRKLFGPEVGIFLMIVTVIGILTWMPVARLVRANFLSLKNKEFVGGTRRRRDRYAHHHEAHPAERAEFGARRGHAGRRRRDHPRIDPLIPWAGLPVRRSDVGTPALRRAELPGSGAAPRALPGSRDLPHRSLGQLHR